MNRNLNFIVHWLDFFRLFLFALFDSLAILPLTSRAGLEPDCWEEGELVTAAAPHERTSEEPATQYCTSVLSALLLPLTAHLLHSLPLQGCLALVRGGPRFLSHLSVHCDCASMSFWKSVCILLVRGVLIDSRTRTKWCLHCWCWGAETGMHVFRHLGE